MYLKCIFYLTIMFIFCWIVSNIYNSIGKIEHFFNRIVIYMNIIHKKLTTKRLQPKSIVACGYLLKKRYFLKKFSSSFSTLLS